MSYIYLTNDKYEILEDSKGACYIKNLEKNKYYFKESLFASKQPCFKKEKILWSIKDTCYLIIIIISLISLLYLILNHEKFTYLHLSTGMKIKALLFLALNLVIHEIGHALTLRYFGRRRGKYRFKISFIFPTICVDTSELYLLPKFEKVCVCYAGIMNNILLSSLVISLFPEQSYLVICVIPLIIFNSMPFGGVETDGYHIIINLLLGVKNYKGRESLISKILRYIFYFISIGILAVTINQFIG